MSFQLPELYVGKEFRWGPPATEITMTGAPIALYQKGDILEPIDWLENQTREEVKEKPKFTIVVDDSRVNALKNQRAKERRRPDGNFRDFAKRPAFHNKNYVKRNITFLGNTTRISDDSIVIGEFVQNDLFKLRNVDVPPVADLRLNNCPPVYDDTMDRVTCGKPRVVDEQMQTQFSHPPTTEDPVLRDLTKQFDGTHPVIVTTDEVLALIMSSPRSVHPWHLGFARTGRWILVTKMTDGNVDMQWVGETADRSRCPTESDPIESERISTLGAESTKAANGFVRECCLKRRHTMKAEKNPFPGLQPRLYRYRRWTVNAGTPKRYDVLVRCEVDAVQNDKFTRIFGLLELNPPDKPSQWMQSLDKNRASFIPAEFKANSCKMSRWICLSILSGAEKMKIGFLSRVVKLNKEKVTMVRDPNQHQVVAVHTEDPLQFGSQIGVHVQNMWSVANAIFGAFINQSLYDKALLVKQTGVSKIQLVQMPADDDSDEDDSDEDDSSDEDGEADE